MTKHNLPLAPRVASLAIKAEQMKTTPLLSKSAFAEDIVKCAIKLIEEIAARVDYLMPYVDDNEDWSMVVGQGDHFDHVTGPEAKGFPSDEPREDHA